MFYKTVKVTLDLDGSLATVTLYISCTPTTPHEELITRAGNILRKATLNATYEVFP